MSVKSQHKNRLYLFLFSVLTNPSGQCNIYIALYMKGCPLRHFMLTKKITAEDRDVFFSLCKDFYNSGATKRGFDPVLTEITFNQVISHHENLWGYFICTDDNTTAGYGLITSYWCNEEGGNVIILDELYVSPEYRHHGFGYAFLRWIESEFKDKAVSVTLEVLSTNIVAKDLYSKSGYFEDGFVTLSKKIEE